MKNKKVLLISAIAFFFSPILHGRIINQPDYDMNGKNFSLSIDRIELTDSAAILTISFYGWPDYGIKLAPETYIKGKASSNTYKIKNIDGITLGEWVNIPEAGYLTSTISFEPIDPVDITIDFIEPGGWEILGIKLYDDTIGKIKTTIKGNVDIPGNGFMLILEMGDDPRVNKSYVAPVKDGKFHYTIYSEYPRLMATYPGIIMLDGRMIPGYFWTEGEEVTIFYSDDTNVPKVEGGELTSKTIQFLECDNNYLENLYYGNEVGRKYKEMEKTGRLFTPEANELHKKLKESFYGKQRREIQEQIDELWEEDKIYSSEGKIVNENYNNFIATSIDSIQIEHLKFFKEQFKEPSLVGLGEIYGYIKFNWETEELIQLFEEIYSDFMPEHPYSIYLSKLSKELNPVPGNHYVDLSVPDLNGEMVTISDIINGKVTVINLWASWCGPCRAHSMALIPVYEKYKDKGFEIIGIARENGNTEAMEKAIEKDGYPWLNLVELNDKFGVWSKYHAGLSGGKQILVDENGIIISIDPTAEEVESYLESRFQKL